MQSNSQPKAASDPGSTFWFTLPYKEAINIIEKAPQKEIQTIEIEKDKLIILVAEDNESDYKLFESILKYDDRLIHAWDGQEAVNLFKEYNPQIFGQSTYHRHYCLCFCLR